MTDRYDDAVRYPALLGAEPPRVPLTPRDLLDSGCTRAEIRRRLCTGELITASRGRYLAGGSPATPLEQLHAIQHRLPKEAVFGFQTGARLLGFGVAPPSLVHVTVPRDCTLPQLAGVAARQHTVPLAAVIDVHGLRCAPPERCAIDLARTLQPPDGLAVLDAALFAGACTPTGLLDELIALERARGLPQARALVHLADGRARCRQESAMRWLMHQYGLPAPQLAVPVRNERGRVRCRVPLAYPTERVGIAFERPPLRAEVIHSWLGARGWTVHAFDDTDLAEPGRFLGRVAEALRAAGHPSLRRRVA